MFNILNDKLVELMIHLSGEHHDNIEASELKAHLALLDDDFYCVLRSKFHWGVAPEK